ncbi:MAG: class I SAM-dependent rRNA methyltransferase [Bacteroidales bacterium]|nr:class I SAM-dependent rRNA methyltransferase [Bacteroidales bacterium]
MKLPQIQIKRNREVSIKRFHPWIFSGAVQMPIPPLNEGELVEVVDDKGQFLAIGHYQPDSIMIRILTFYKENVDVNFFLKRISSCWEYRKRLNLREKQTNVFRLVHGEGDGLPGLIIDYYNGLAVVQCHSAGMLRMLTEICEALILVLKNELKAVYNKSEATLPPKFIHNINDGFIFNICENPLEIKENNHYFLVDFIQGQKTGFFIDQRENRKLLASFSANKSVANLYGYTGAFSVYAASAGAKEVITVDSSAKALAIAEKNYSLNKLSNIRNIEMDVLDFLRSNIQYFDIIILDPPAFAKHQKHKESALRAYKQINAKAMRWLNAGGILFSFSCSQAITANDLRQAIFVAAASEQKSVRIMHQLHQPPDHPISIFHPEGEYLKGFVLQVE